MTDGMMAEAAHRFIKQAANFKGESRQMLALETIHLAQHTMLGEGQKGGATMQGSGLDVIFRKLNQMRDEIKADQKIALATMTTRRSECAKQVGDANNIVKSSSNTKYLNYRMVQEAKTKTMPQTRKLRADSPSLKPASTRHWSASKRIAPQKQPSRVPRSTRRTRRSTSWSRPLFWSASVSRGTRPPQSVSAFSASRTWTSPCVTTCSRSNRPWH